MPIFSAFSPIFLSALCGSSFDFDFDSADFALGLLTSPHFILRNETTAAHPLLTLFR
jgi:hypothetical protein